MIEAVMLWNEPNNKSHWDFAIDPEWQIFGQMTRCAAQAIYAEAPSLPKVLGGISPIDPEFIRNMGSQGVLDCLQVVAVHGFPLDWNHWDISEWPYKLQQIREVTDLPVWVSEVGASSFGAEEVQEFGLHRTAQLLLGCVPRIHWYSLYDLPAAWPATTRHREAEGSSYYRHFHMGLLREDGTPKRALAHFHKYTPGLGVCQWFHFEDHRLEDAVGWLRRLIQRIAGQIRRHGWTLAAVFLLELLSTPLTLLSPVGIKIAIDNVVGGKPVPHILQVLLPATVLRSPGSLLLAAVAIQILVVLLIQTHWLCNYLLKIRTGGHMVLSLRSRLFRHLQSLPLGYHDVRGSADSAFRVQDDAAALRSITIDGALFLLSDIIKLLGMIGVTLFIDWRLGLVALSIVPLLVIYSVLYQYRVGDRYKKVKEMESAALRVVHEVLSTMRVVKAFVQEEKENKRFEQRSAAAEKARLRLAYADAIFGFVVNFTTAFGMAMVLLVGIRNVQAGVLTLGSLLLIITYLVQLYAPLQNITYHLASLKASAASVARAFEVLEAEPEVLEQQPVTPANGDWLQRVSGDIRFEDVTFSYGDKPPILQNFSFCVPAGSHVGVIGRTGVGKTTLVNLLVRFVSPTSGRIVLDGRDVQSFNLAELRRQFAFVLQEPVLFSTTIAENIAYGRPGASHEDVVNAAKAASVHEFIERLPRGYYSEVGERGLLLSGGERQRISIARAFLQDAPILILDEPTSALDTATETEILRTLETLIAGRTCFLISHRLDALSDCNYILNLNNGTWIEVTADSQASPFALPSSLQTIHRVASQPEADDSSSNPEFIPATDLG